MTFSKPIFLTDGIFFLKSNLNKIELVINLFEINFVAEIMQLTDHRNLLVPL